MRALTVPTLLCAVSAVAVMSCGPAEEGCTDKFRAIGLDDGNVTGMTGRQIGARFHVGDVVWSCSLAWGLLGDQTEATWSPHDTTTTATASLRFGDDSATEVTGIAPAGSRLACIPRITIDLLFDLASDDGGFADSWSATGTFLQTSNNLSLQFDPHTAGGFHGSYTYTLLGTWPEAFTTINVAAYSARLEGSLFEATRRATSATTGEGFGVRSAVWQCEQSTPAQ